MRVGRVGQRVDVHHAQDPVDGVGFPPPEDPATQTRVGIGVVTGADGVYITQDDNIAEPNRLLPLSMVSDIASGQVTWSGHYLINPWDDEGLVRLQNYPRLFNYFDDNAAASRKRNVVGRQPDRWYRTIDRVIPGRPAFRGTSVAAR